MSCVCELDKKETFAEKLMWVVVQYLSLFYSVVAAQCFSLPCL